MKKRKINKYVVGCIFILLLIIINKLHLLAIVCFILFLYILIKKTIISYKQTILKKDLENALTEEILKLTTISFTGDIKQIINHLSVSRNKTISKEFIILKKKIMQGHNINNLFESLKKKYSSDILDKFLNLILISYKTGTTSYNDFKNLVDEFLKSKQIMQERNSMLLMQRYTIIFSGTIIIPLILGVVISLVKKLQTTFDMSLLGFEINNRLFVVGYYCSIIYIIEYIIVSSIYLSTIDNNPKKFIVYLLVFLPVSLALFFLAPVIF
jgi:hypothetical protein